MPIKRVSTKKRSTKRSTKGKGTNLAGRPRIAVPEYTFGHIPHVGRGRPRARRPLHGRGFASDMLKKAVPEIGSFLASELAKMAINKALNKYSST